MHSRIYVLADDIDVDVISTPMDYELYDYIKSVNPLADYVSNSGDFDGDIEWLCETYKIKAKKVEGKYAINRKELLNKLKKDKIKNIKEAKNILCTTKPEDLSNVDIYKIVSLLKNNDNFLFYYNDDLLTPNDLIDYIKHSNSEYIYIIDTFDYHY